MPPKGGWKPVPDLSWVSTEVHVKEEITQEHIRRAGGLHSVPTHLYSVDPAKGDCSARLCASNPRCYRRLGVKDVYDRKKEDYVEERLDHSVVKERNGGPAGLRNLGATCYANAFLQVWYHNVAFRNGVYTAVKSATPRTPLYHLALIFAQLGYSDRAVVDPTPLIDALGLGRTDQQDAAEFAKLFTSLIASAFTAQADQSVKNLMQDLFEGKMEHRVQCLKCNFVSKRYEAFAELDLGTKNNATIQECLQDLQQPERLEGDNRYRCPRCESLQIATRSSRPVVLPPVLNLCLMRFTYTSKGRVKRKAVIRYGKEMMIGGVEYHLKAVVTHHGSSAMSGHFTCEVFDQETEQWLNCNDEHVGPVSGNKKQKRDNTGLNSSADAYMLVYVRADTVDPIPPSRVIQDIVELDNVALSSHITEMRRREEVLQDDFGHLQGAKKEVIEVLEGSDCPVYAEAITEWLKADLFDQLFKPFTEWPAEDLCEHQQVTPRNLQKGLLISAEAFDTLSTYSFLPDLSLCRTCIEEDFTKAFKTKQREKMVETFDELDSLSSERYIIPTRWLQGWRNGETGNDSPTDGSDALVCKHGHRWDEGKAETTVSTEALEFLRALFPSPFIAHLETDPSCSLCFAEYAEELEANKEMLDRIKDENVIKPFLNNMPPPFDIDHYLLPKKWVDEWTVWRKKQGQRPKLELGLCVHGGLDWDPCLEWPSYATERGWREIVQRYGNVEPILIRFGPNPLPGKRTTVTSVQPAVCDECRIKRSSDFDRASIVVVVGKAGQTGKTGDVGVADLTFGTRRSRRTKTSEVRVEVTKATTIKEIKLEICASYGVSPIAQTLRYGGRELDSDLTVGAAGILASDEVQCEVVEERQEDLTRLGVGASEGFGGTALLGGIACGQCTFVNAGAATSCEMCQKAL